MTRLIQDREGTGTVPVHVGLSLRDLGTWEGGSVLPDSIIISLPTFAVLHTLKSIHLQYIGFSWVTMEAG